MILDRNSLSEDNVSEDNVSDYDCAHDVLFVINGNTGKLMDRVFLYSEDESDKEGGVYNLAVNSNTAKIYVTSFYSSGGNIVLYLMDRSNPKDAKTIEMPVDDNGVKDVIVNPKTNDIYFINGINDTSYYIKVMDGHTNKILKKY